MLDGKGLRVPRTMNDARPESGARGSSTHGTVDGDAAWANWLRGIKWDWFVTLAYRGAAGGVSAGRVKHDAAEWLDALRASAPKAYAVVVVEAGDHFGGWHAHVLIGGLGAHPSWETTLVNTWRPHGHAHVVRYDPAKDPKHEIKKGVVPYLRKQVDAELEIVGTLKRYRPRRRTKAD